MEEYNSPLKQEILIVAGEASADKHAAHVLEALQKEYPQLHAFGVGDKELEKQGMEILIPSKRLSLVGFFEWIHQIFLILKDYFYLKKEIRLRRPRCAILLDLPDFNLSLAKFLKKQKIPVVYYISPQVWAWRKYRIRKIRKRVDKMLVIFPFEKRFYEKHNFPAVFVGHPLLDEISARKQYRTQEEILHCPRIAILPGSRESEIINHAPILQSVIQKGFALFPQCIVRIPVASTLSVDFLKKAFSFENHFSPTQKVSFEENQYQEIVEWADVALVASGTATLETALMGTPFCLFYRFSPLTGWFVHWLRVFLYPGFFGMPNLLHGREIVREFIHDKAEGPSLFLELKTLLFQSEYRKEMIENLLLCRNLLQESGTSYRVACEIKDFLRK